MGDAFSDADVAIGQPRLSVPARFEDYLRYRHADELADRVVCTCCGHEDRCWQLPDNEGPYCPRCMGYQHGYDQAQETVLRFVFAGLVAGALSAEVSIGETSRALTDALDEQRERQASESERLYGRDVPRGKP